MTTNRVQPAGRTQRPLRSKARAYLDRGVDLIVRVATVGGLIALGAYVAAQQVVSPQRRMVKLSVVLALMALMFRFDMVWSIYLFTILFPFPSAVSIGSTNLVLLTVIPLIWVVRASSQRLRLLRPTPLDAAIGLLLIAYALSFYNVEDQRAMAFGARVMWRQICCCVFFYLIVNFVDSEEKLRRMIKATCLSAGLVMVTAIVEMFSPGTAIIPGWIDMRQFEGAGRLTFRIEKMRVGGAVASHAMLSDYASNTVWLMCYLYVKARNPIEKLLWAALVAVTLTAMLASGNRGAIIGFTVGFLWLLVILRRRIGTTRIILILLSMLAMLTVTQMMLEKYTYAASVRERLLATKIVAMQPENRVRIWGPTLMRAMEHPILGHGPWYATTHGLDPQYWPHNGYLYYLYTIGILGTGAFLLVLGSVFKLSFRYRRPGVADTEAGTIMKLLQVWLIISAIGQLRTDHQRDDIYPFIIWLSFGLVAATASIIDGGWGERGSPGRPPERPAGGSAGGSVGGSVGGRSGGRSP